MSNEIENMARDLALRGYAKKTRQHYLKAARALLGRFGRPLAELSREELREYVEELSRTMNASALRRQLCGLLFLYRRSLGQPELVSFISLPKKYSRLPDVLSLNEVNQLLNAFTKPRYQAIAMVLYGAGLRLSEGLVLEVSDIDGARGVLRVRHGKGNKAREVMLSAELYQWLRQYWARHQPPQPYLFASKTGKLPTADTFRTALAKAAQAAFIKKHVTPHVLRHSFATHLLEQGTDVHVVGALLGHASLRSTVRYARVTRKVVRQTPSPLDLLPKKPW